MSSDRFKALGHLDFTDERGSVALNVLFIVAAVVLFVILAVVVVVDDTPDGKTQTLLLASGLASFAAGHLPV